MSIDFTPVEGNALMLLISQYYKSDNLKNYIRAMVRPLQENMELCSLLTDLLSIDIAYGETLDRVGRIVGVAREVPDAVALGLFGFFSNAAAEGMNVGIFRSRGADSTKDLVLNDNQYRKFIRAKILVNTAGGRREDIIEYVELILGRKVDIEITAGSASFNIRVHETLSIDDKALLMVTVKNVKSVGVDITMDDDAGIIALT